MRIGQIGRDEERLIAVVIAQLLFESVFLFIASTTTWPAEPGEFILISGKAFERRDKPAGRLLNSFGRNRDRKPVGNIDERYCHNISTCRTRQPAEIGDLPKNPGQSSKVKV